MATKKQSRPKVKGLVNPKGVTQVFGTPIDFKALPEKITIGRRVANGKFKLEAHYPAKHFNDKHYDIDFRNFKYVHFLKSKSIGLTELFEDVAQCRYLGCTSNY